MRLRFLKSLLLHKWYVFRGGRMLGGIPLWRLIVHDWSKFGTWEFSRYAANFFGDYTKSSVDRASISEDFAIAWLHHENFNPHHVGYWIPRTAQFKGIPLRMPDTFVREMVADWLGASRAYTGSWDMTEWLDKNFDRHTTLMHPRSVTYLRLVLHEIGYSQWK
jgi:hypothetical protein